MREQAIGSLRPNQMMSINSGNNYSQWAG